MWHPIRCLWTVILVLGGAFVGRDAQADVLLDGADTQAVRDAVEFPLPALADVLGVEPHRRGAPVVVVADWNEGDADCRVRALGRAIGATLRVEAWGLSRQVAYSHPTGYWADGRAGNQPEASTPAQRVVRRVGATHWLVGRAVLENDTLVWHSELRRVGSDEILAKRDTRFAQSGISAALAEEITALLGALHATVVPEDQARLDRLGAADAGEFEALHLAFLASCDNANYARSVEKAWLTQSASPTLAAHYLDEVGGLYSPPAAVEKIANVTAATADHPLVHLIADYRTVYLSPQNRNPDAIVRMKRLAAQYANEPVALRALADAMAGEQVMYGFPDGIAGMTRVVSAPMPNYPPYAEALALTLRSVEDWPHDYRSWWGVAQAELAYADAMRGAQFPGQMDELTTRRYPQLFAVADHALTEAIRLHPVQAGLYEMQIDVDVERGRDFMDSFNQAVALTPHREWLYRCAFNYAQDQWGGNARLRRQLYDLARKNNPDAAWPATMYRAWAGVRESFWVIHGRDIAIGAVVLALGLAFFILRQRRRAQT